MRGANSGQKLADPNYETLAAAERLLESVIERDPEYAPAYAVLAGAYGLMADWGMIPRTEASGRMILSAEQALVLDNQLAEGWVHLSRARRADGDLEGARAARQRALEFDPRNPLVLRGVLDHWSRSHEPERGLVYADELLRVDPLSPVNLFFIAYFELGDVVAAKYWSEAALKLDPRAPWAKVVVALLHLYRDEEAEAIEIARELTRPGVLTRNTLGIALRIADAPKLAAGHYEEIIDRYLTDHPELGDGKVPISDSWGMEVAIVVTLNLASVYLQAGEEARAETLLSASESEMPHWPQAAAWGWGYGFANVDLHALRGEEEQALVALREGAAKGTRYLWRLQLLYNPNLDSIRDTAEFAAIIAEIEADMAEQLARVRAMQRSGELTAIPDQVVQ